MTRCIEPTKYQATAAREEAQRLEAAIRQHADAASEHAAHASIMADQEGEDVYRYAAAAQAEAAAAQALALLRRPRSVETR